MVAEWLVVVTTIYVPLTSMFLRKRWFQQTFCSEDGCLDHVASRFEPADVNGRSSQWMKWLERKYEENERKERASKMDEGRRRVAVQSGSTTSSTGTQETSAFLPPGSVATATAMKKEEWLYVLFQCLFNVLKLSSCRSQLPSDTVGSAYELRSCLIGSKGLLASCSWSISFPVSCFLLISYPVHGMLQA